MADDLLVREAIQLLQNGLDLLKKATGGGLQALLNNWERVTHLDVDLNGKNVLAEFKKEFNTPIERVSIDNVQLLPDASGKMRVLISAHVLPAFA